MQYYMQAVSGQFDLMNRARPIDEVLAEQSTSATLRTKLQHVRSIRHFASAELGLPDNGSYRGYADLGRPFVVWNVFAAPALSVEPKQNCFLFVGCVSYRGYYSLADAQNYAAELKAQGFDTYIGGVPVYSTLGWFNDPVLNTFVGYPEAELARLIFHELAHQQVFAKGDTAFNESFAVTVEREGVRRWLDTAGTERDRQRYAQYDARRQAFYALLLRYRNRLADWYATPRPPEQQREGKLRLFAELGSDYLALKQSWGGFAGYDRFFAGGANNAFLASIAAYTELVPAFEALLARDHDDLPRFYASVKNLAELNKSERDTQLANLKANHNVLAAGAVQPALQ
jgi:predicted aminopeptidase